jgi:hypothetical protein
MSDLIERLRKRAREYVPNLGAHHVASYSGIMTEAADEIERLRVASLGQTAEISKLAKQIDRYRTALLKIASLHYDNTSAATIAQDVLEL